MSRIEEAVQLLSEGGVIDRLKEEAQFEREAERGELLAKLAQVEQAEAARAAELAKVRPALLQKITRLETELQTARNELDALNVPTGFTVEKLRGKLRRLADPRIGLAIAYLLDLGDRARHTFVSAPQRVKKLSGGHETTYVTNGEQIAEVQASVKAAVRKLEAIQEAARPTDLDAVLVELVDPIKLAVQRLHGLH